MKGQIMSMPAHVFGHQVNNEIYKTSRMINSFDFDLSITITPKRAKNTLFHWIIDMLVLKVIQ